MARLTKTWPTVGTSQAQWPTKQQEVITEVDTLLEADATAITALDAAKIPTAGLRGQVLTKQSATNYDDAWLDVPGIVYPSLLLSPDGSFDRSGAVTPTVGGNVTIESGVYGHAWGHEAASSRTVLVPNTTAFPSGFSAFTIIGRGRLITYTGDGLWLLADNSGAWTTGAMLKLSAGGLVSSGHIGGSASVPFASVGSPGAAGFAFADPAIMMASPAAQGYSRRTTAYTFSANLILGHNQGMHTESVLFYPAALPVSEIARIIAIPAAWSMANAVANVYLPNSPWQLFDPTNRIAAGGATARVAPGAATQDINTLSANTLIADTGQRRNVSSVDYALIWTQQCGQCWVPLSALTTL